MCTCRQRVWKNDVGAPLRSNKCLISCNKKKRNECLYLVSLIYSHTNGFCHSENVKNISDNYVQMFKSFSEITIWSVIPHLQKAAATLLTGKLSVSSCFSWNFHILDHRESFTAKWNVIPLMYLKETYHAFKSFVFTF